MKLVRVGSRESALAVRQAMIVMDAVTACDPSVRTRLVTMTTTGDKRQDRPIEEIGGKGVFVKELEQALLDGEVDLCVHSLKDMAGEIDPRIPIRAMSVREDPRDVLVLPLGARELDPALPVGCSSLRRRVQLQELYPGCRVEPVRGNVLTRLDKLDSGQYGALVLAAAGLIRLGLENRISRRFSPVEMLPACGQGILAVQGRAGEPLDFLEGFHSADSWDAALAERAFTRALEGGCTSPVTAYAEVHGERICITGYAVDAAGNMLPGAIRGDRARAGELGEMLANNLRREAQGG